MKTLWIVLGLLGVLLVAVGTVAAAYVGTSNTEVGLRNQFNAQNQVLRTNFDKTFKIIQQQAGVSEEYSDSFRKNYSAIMQGRYGEKPEKALLNFVQESNPEFSTKLFEKLSNSIEVQRTEFTNAQDRAIDIKREHDNLRGMFPGSLFVGGRPELKLELVTSAKTEEAFSTGQDNDISLFKSDREEKGKK